MANSRISPSRWSELRGKSEWESLLNPRHDDLRRYIIHYGQMAGSVGDVYEFNRDGKLPKYEFFEKACLVKGNAFKYTVIDYLYAGSPASWFGFVAEGKDITGRRDILIVWRGTKELRDWLTNARFSLKSASNLFNDPEAKVHSGFLELYMSARDQVLRVVSNAWSTQRDETSITVAGFSLGGAMATLTAMDLAYKNYRVTAFTFGSPRVGNYGLKQVYNRLAESSDLHLLRIKNTNDIVTMLPPPPYYEHVGTKLRISVKNSKYFKNNNVTRAYEDEDDTRIPTEWEINEFFEEATDRGTSVKKSTAHNMDVYLHLIALKDDGYTLVDNHDIALVNKYLDFLRDENKIPSCWWEAEDHKNMVQRDDGRWELRGSTRDPGSRLGNRKRALLVGCNYPNTRLRLQGCINDVSGIKNLIEKNFDFKSNDIKVLTDDGSSDLPTHANIMKELNDMADKAEAGDELFFHFSGHGTLIPSLEPGGAYKEDMDLRHLIQKLKVGTSFTMLSDSCHSGGLIGQDKEQIGPRRQTKGLPIHKDYHYKDRFFSLTDIYNCAKLVAGAVDSVVTNTTGKPIMQHVGDALTGIFSRDVSIEFQPDKLQEFLDSMRTRSVTEDEGILLSGCQAYETSADVADAKEPHGAFTYAVLEVLKKHQGEALTNKQLVTEVMRHLQGEKFNQHPCLYCCNGKANAPFLGGSVKKIN